MEKTRMQKAKLSNCSYATDQYPLQMMNKNHIPPITPVTSFLFFNSISFIGVKS